MEKNRKRLLLILCLVLVLFCAFQLVTFRNLEITDKGLFSVYRTTSFAMFGVLLLAISIALPKDYSGLFGRLGLIVFILFAGLVWAFKTVLFPFNEARRDLKILFVNKENANLLIIEQVTYAGAIGSDHYDTVLTHQLIKNVRWTKPIQVSAIDKSVWLPATQ